MCPLPAVPQPLSIFNLMPIIFHPPPSLTSNSLQNDTQHAGTAVNRLQGFFNRVLRVGGVIDGAVLDGRLVRHTATAALSAVLSRAPYPWGSGSAWAPGGRFVPPLARPPTLDERRAIERLQGAAEELRWVLDGPDPARLDAIRNAHNEGDDANVARLARVRSTLLDYILWDGKVRPSLMETQPAVVGLYLPWGKLQGFRGMERGDVCLQLFNPPDRTQSQNSTRASAPRR